MIFAVASLLAVATGCLVAAANGAPPAVWGRNAIAWLLGALISKLLARQNPTRLIPAILLITPILLLLSLWQSGQSGVHRWLSFGPLNWNVAFLCLPAAIVALTATPRPPWPLAFIVASLLCLQPDASQVTAFALALSLSQPLVLPFAALTWTRPDPLLPVPDVEGIIALARSQSLLRAAIVVASLTAVALSPLFPRRTASATALAIYFLAISLMPLVGAFPVPLAGMGMSPILGYWLGIGVLSATTKPAMLT